jgi:hypothetical protein
MCAQNKQEQICKNNNKCKNMHNDNHLKFKNKGGGGGVSKAEWLIMKALPQLNTFIHSRAFFSNYAVVSA